MIWLIILGVSIVATAMIKGLEIFLGADKVFLGALILMPFVFIWCLLTAKK